MREKSDPMLPYHCYGLDHFRYEYEALARFDPDGYWYKRNEVDAELAALRQWQQDVLEAAIVYHVYRKEHETDGKACVNDVINWHVATSGDPTVSTHPVALEIKALREHVAEAVRMIEGYKRAGWLTNPAAAEQATDFIARAAPSAGTTQRQGDDTP